MAAHTCWLALALRLPVYLLAVSLLFWAVPLAYIGGFIRLQSRRGRNDMYNWWAGGPGEGVSGEHRAGVNSFLFTHGPDELIVPCCCRRAGPGPAGACCQWLAGGRSSSLAWLPPCAQHRRSQCLREDLPCPSPPPNSSRMQVQLQWVKAVRAGAQQLSPGPRCMYLVRAAARRFGPGSVPCGMCGKRDPHSSIWVLGSWHALPANQPHSSLSGRHPGQTLSIFLLSHLHAYMRTEHTLTRMSSHSTCSPPPSPPALQKTV